MRACMPFYCLAINPTMSLDHNPASVSGRGGRGFPEIKNRELKERAVAFYAKHKVTDALEKLLNELFLEAPTDVYGYMVGAMSLDQA